MTVETFNQLINKLSVDNPHDFVIPKEELKGFDLNVIIPQLVDTIKDDENSRHERLIAIKSLRCLENRSSLGKLKHILLHDDDNFVRIALITFIGSLKEASMIDTLTKVVNRDDDPAVIKAASLAIQVIQGVTDISSLDEF